MYPFDIDSFHINPSFDFQFFFCRALVPMFLLFYTKKKQVKFIESIVEGANILCIIDEVRNFKKKASACFSSREFPELIFLRVQVPRGATKFPEKKFLKQLKIPSEEIFFVLFISHCQKMESKIYASLATFGVKCETGEVGRTVSFGGIS
jgi:hypothetical protein